MIRTAFIGLSGYGSIIYRLCKKRVEAGEIKVVAAVIRSPSKVQEIIEDLREMNCRIFSTSDEMFEIMKGQLDLVCICTGINTHASLTISALDAGAHVMVEKPAAATVSDVDAMIEASKKANRIVAVGFQDIYRPDIQSVKQRLLENEWGKIIEIKIVGRWPRPTSYYARNNWAGCIKIGNDLVYDSPANNALAHFINLGLFMAGDRLKESAQVTQIEADLFRAYPIESFDTIVSRIQTKSGLKIYFSVSHATNCHLEPIVTIHTENAQVILENSRCWVGDHDGNLLEEICQSGQDIGRENIFPMLLASIRGEDSVICSLSIARSHTAFIEQLHVNHEIQNFPPDMVYKETTHNSTQLVVRNLDSLMDEASKNGCLFSEMNLPWLNNEIK